MAARRRRGSGGHPARVAERRQRQRERREGRSGLSEQERERRAFVAAVIEEAEELDHPLQAQLWASELLGPIWEDRTKVDFADWEEAELALGGELVERLGKTERPGALVALLALASTSDGELGLLARDRARELRAGGLEPPAWTGELERDPAITAAGVMVDAHFGDAETVLIEATYEDGERVAIAVHLDRNLGLSAAGIAFLDSIDVVDRVIAEEYDPEDPGGPVRFERIEPPEAAARIADAMLRTDDTLEPLVEEDYARGRALALLIADSVAGALPEGAVVGPPEVDPDQREQVLAAFLGSAEAEAARIAPDSDAALAVSLAIDFCCEVGDGDPLRWSPMRARLLLAGWVPEKVIGDEELPEALPGALAAFVRYAHRSRGVPERATAVVLAEIEAAVEPMREALAAGPSGPTGELVTAARERGVDLADPEQLEAFISDWNEGRTG